MRLYALVRHRLSVHEYSSILKFIITSTYSRHSLKVSLLFITEILLVVHAVIVDKAIVFRRNFLARCEAGTRFGLAGSRHSGLRRGGLWVLLLGHGVASVDPVEVDVYGLGEVCENVLAVYTILVVWRSAFNDIQLADIW